MKTKLQASKTSINSIARSMPVGTLFPKLANMQFVPISKIIPFWVVLIGVLFSSSQLALGQPWTYNFGTGTGTYNTNNSASTSFFSSTPTDGGTYRVRRSNNQGGSFELANPGTTLGSATELQINAPTGGSLYK